MFGGKKVLATCAEPALNMHRTLKVPILRLPVAHKPTRFPGLLSADHLPASENGIQTPSMLLRFYRFKAYSKTEDNTWRVRRTMSLNEQRKYFHKQSNRNQFGSCLKATRSQNEFGTMCLLLTPVALTFKLAS